jgi:flagellar biosynthesis/type III secretory pathway chaperone
MVIRMENMTVYVTAMQDSLQKKLEVLNSLLRLSKEQGTILATESPDLDRFGEIISEKEGLIETMKTLDKGFESLYAKVGATLKEKRYQYQSQIQEMQNLIRSITDTGVRIEGVEHRNKAAFTKYLSESRKEIKTFYINNRTAASYHQNMANQHRSWQTYFVDQKK